MYTYTHIYTDMYTKRICAVDRHILCKHKLVFWMLFLRLLGALYPEVQLYFSCSSKQKQNYLCSYITLKSILLYQKSGPIQSQGKY